MDFQLSVYSISFFIVAVCSMLVSLILLAKRQGLGENFLGYALLAGAWWAACDGLQVGATNQDMKYLFSALLYAGSYAVAPFLLLFSLRYAALEKFCTPVNIAILWIIPLVMLVLAATNAWHHLVWTGIQPVDGADGIYRFMRGPAYWMGVVYIYACLVLVLALLLYRTFKSRLPFYRRQGIIVVAAMLPPWTVNLLYLLRINALNGLDLTPHAFALTGVVLAVGISKFSFLDLSPIAQSILFRKLPDGILVLDGQFRVRDANDAAMRVIGRDFAAIKGQLAGDCVEALTLDTLTPGNCPDPSQEICLDLPDGKRHCFDVELSPLLSYTKRKLGYLLQFRDISPRKQMEIKEHEQRLIAEAMQNIALTITSNFDISQVLETVADNMGKTIPNMSCGIILHGEAGKFQLAAMRGDPHPDLPKWFADGTITMASMPLYRKMAETGTSMIVPDIRENPDWLALDDRIRSWICAPIKIMDEIFGFLSFEHSQANFYTEQHKQNLKAFADLTAIIIKHAKMYRENELLANTDPLTSLSNRRHFFSVAETEFERTHRYGGPLSMLMIDIDHLKEINDQFGHFTGDRAILEAANTLRRCLRDHDVCARFGGDEFCVLLPATDAVGAMETAMRLVAEVRRIQLGLSADDLIISFSIGVASLQHRALLVDDLMIEADRALYRAKNKGRNQASL